MSSKKSVRTAEDRTASRKDLADRTASRKDLKRNFAEQWPPLSLQQWEQCFCFQESRFWSLLHIPPGNSLRSGLPEHSLQPQASCQQPGRLTCFTENLFQGIVQNTFQGFWQIMLQNPAGIRPAAGLKLYLPGIILSGSTEFCLKKKESWKNSMRSGRKPADLLLLSCLKQEFPRKKFPWKRI